jgi:phosphoribosylamine--glycine ligase
MKILVVGNGAREHAIAWKLSQSKRISGLYCVPGNAGTEEFAENLVISPDNHPALINACKARGVDIVVVGPEGPLANGLADSLLAEGIPTFGPRAAHAKLESSKAFGRAFAERHGIPCAKTEKFTDPDKFERYIRKNKGKVVLKKSGLAQGKGVIESSDNAELLEFGKQALDGDELLVEEFLTGYELSIFALTDGERYLLLPPCADHKKSGERDTGVNTGGMGALCPVIPPDPQVLRKIKQAIIEPTFAGMKKDKLNYRGVVFFGVMVTEKGPKLLEYNVRFGDPETQSLLAAMDCDFVDLIEACASGSLSGAQEMDFHRFAIGIVVAAEGYPGPYAKNRPVSLPDVLPPNVQIFHASTGFDAEKRLVTGGGRCFTVVATADDGIGARELASRWAGSVKFEGAWYRNDIGLKFYT